jgi:hypothetical protein
MEDCFSLASGGVSSAWLWDETQAIPIRSGIIYANAWLQQLSSLLIAAPMSILSMCKRRFSLASLAMTLLAGVVVPQTSAQSFNVLYTFHSSDGAHPETGLTMDRGGTLYGTTVYGGSGGSVSSCAYQEGCGVIFQLVHRGSEWILNPLHRFTGGSDGSGPGGRVLFGPGGLPYGTATAGGARKRLCPQGCGTVFTLRPSGKALRGMAAKTSLIAFGVVPSLCSLITSPASSTTQYQLKRSPKSNPIVNFRLKFLLLTVAAVLLFFIAGLLYLLRFERVDNLGAYSIPSETGLLIPSDFANNALARFTAAPL